MGCILNNSINKIFLLILLGGVGILHPISLEVDKRGAWDTKAQFFLKKSLQVATLGVSLTSSWLLFGLYTCIHELGHAIPANMLNEYPSYITLFKNRFHYDDVPIATFSGIRLMSWDFLYGKSYTTSLSAPKECWKEGLVDMGGPVAGMIASGLAFKYIPLTRWTFPLLAVSSFHFIANITANIFPLGAYNDGSLLAQHMLGISQKTLKNATPYLKPISIFLTAIGLSCLWYYKLPCATRQKILNELVMLASVFDPTDDL